MSNELIFILSALADILLVFIVARRMPQRLFGVVVMNLVLVTIFGSKLIVLFGFVTNAGNVFYACTFLATHFIFERKGAHDTWPTIWVGAGAVLWFIILSQSAVHLSSSVSPTLLNDAFGTIFSFSLRIALASILSFIFAQYINISIYEWLSIRTQGKLLWFRSNASNIVAQLVDSMLFFSIVFFDLPGPLLVQTILVGWVVKTIVVSMGTPFLYLNNYLTNKKK